MPLAMYSGKLPTPQPAAQTAMRTLRRPAHSFVSLLRFPAIYCEWQRFAGLERKQARTEGGPG
jgi:hypothetical protein